MSSGSLRAHAELLGQRLQAPPVFQLYPLLSYGGRYEHGVGSEEPNEEGCLQSSGRRENSLLAFFIFVLNGGEGVDGAEMPLVRLISASDPTLWANLTPAGGGGCSGNVLLLDIKYRKRVCVTAD